MAIDHAITGLALRIEGTGRKRLLRGKIMSLVERRPAGAQRSLVVFVIIAGLSARSERAHASADQSECASSQHPSPLRRIEND